MTAAITVLVVDDHPTMRRGLADLFASVSDIALVASAGQTLAVTYTFTTLAGLASKFQSNRILSLMQAKQNHFSPKKQPMATPKHLNVPPSSTPLSMLASTAAPATTATTA